MTSYCLPVNLKRSFLLDIITWHSAVKFATLSLFLPLQNTLYNTWQFLDTSCCFPFVYILEQSPNVLVDKQTRQTRKGKVKWAFYFSCFQWTRTFWGVCLMFVMWEKTRILCIPLLSGPLFQLGHWVKSIKNEITEFSRKEHRSIQIWITSSKSPRPWLH